MKTAIKEAIEVIAGTGLLLLITQLALFILIWLEGSPEDYRPFWATGGLGLAGAILFLASAAHHHLTKGDRP